MQRYHDVALSRRMIDEAQNHKDGKTLGKSYTHNRILNKDKYLTWTKP